MVINFKGHALFSLWPHYFVFSYEAALQESRKTQTNRLLLHFQTHLMVVTINEGNNHNMSPEGKPVVC